MKAWNLFYKQFITYGGYHSVLDGLLATVEIAVFGLLIGVVIGTLIAVVKVMQKNKFIINNIVIFYIFTNKH